MTDFHTISDPPSRLLTGASLFLDLDGTLLELAESPSEVEVTQAVRDVLLLAAARLDGRVAIVSGRSAADVASLVPDIPVHISGSHGAEIVWTDGRRSLPERSPQLDQALEQIRAFASGRPGLFVEDKPYGVALHYRLAPELEEECRALALRLSRDTGLPLQPGKMVQELKTSTRDKGNAIAALMSEEPMKHGIPIFLGDDANDEAGFAVAAQMGGAGILVGRERSTGALWRLPNVKATLAWLASGLEGSQ